MDTRDSGLPFESNLNTKGVSLKANFAKGPRYATDFYQVTRVGMYLYPRTKQETDKPPRNKGGQLEFKPRAHFLDPASIRALGLELLYSVNDSAQGSQRKNIQRNLVRQDSFSF